MSRFSATTRSGAIVPAERMAIWAALTDPQLLPRLTPLLDSIDAHDELWTWRMASISALGVSIAPAFTERMDFVEGRSIRYTHQPPPGSSERAGAEGHYRLADHRGGTRLEIELTLCVDLPLPRHLAPAVNRVIKATMTRTGERFSTNLLRHLGVAGPWRPVAA